MAQNYGPNIVTNNLILSLDAADINSYPRSGTDWFDVSGYGYNGTLVNGPTFSSANKGSIVFDGVDDYVTLSDFSSQFPTNSITVISWAKVTSSVSKPTCLTFNGAFNFFYPGFRISNPNLTQLYWDSATSWKNASTYYTLGDIRCFAWTINSTALTFYNNAVADGTGTVNKFTPSGPIRLCLGNAGEYQVGNVYNISIYNRALSAAEILQNYNMTKTRFGL
jgi:hypothetical protein